MRLCVSLNVLWHFPSLGLEWKLTFSSPVATAEFSKFADTLSAALSQPHLLGFWIAQLEFHHFHEALVVAMLPKAHLTSHSRISGSRWVTTASWLSRSLRLFYVLFFCVFLPGEFHGHRSLMGYSPLGLYMSTKSRTWYSLVVLLSQFWTSPLFHVWFKLLLLDLQTGFSGGK